MAVEDVDVKRTEAEDGIVTYTVTVQPQDDMAIREAAAVLDQTPMAWVHWCLAHGMVAFMVAKDAARAKYEQSTKH